jgi:sugar phosphate isomerase/epimerase
MNYRIGITDFTYFLTRFHYKAIEDLDILDRAVGLGVGSVQIDTRLRLPDGGVAHRRDVRERAQKLGLRLVGSGGWLPEGKGFADLLAAGREMGVDVIRFATSVFRGRAKPPSVETMIADLKAVAKAYEKARVVLAIENHQDFTSAEMAAIFQAVGSPNLGVCLDTGNSIALLEDPVETARTLAPYVRAMHLKEYVVWPAAGGFDLVGVGMGRGVVDHPAVVAALEKGATAASLDVMIENPLERCAIPVLSPAVLAEFGGRTLASLGPVVKLMEESAKKFPKGLSLPQEAGLPPEQAMAVEESVNREAVAYARRLLGGGA